MTGEVRARNSVHWVERQASLRAHLIGLPRPLKRLLMVAADAGFISASVLLAVVVTAEVSWARAPDLALVVLFAVVLTIVAFWRLGLYRAVVRFLQSRAIVALALGATASVVPLSLAMFSPGLEAVTWRTLIVHWAFALLYLAGSRFIMRDFLHRRERPAENVIIYGAGAAGARLAAMLGSGNECLPVAFVDDSRAVQGNYVAGLKVYAPDAIPGLLEEFHVERALLAIPSTSRRRKKDILRRLEQYPLHVQTVPDFNDLISGRARVDDLKEVEVDDLLGRDPVPPQPELISACILNHSVMVTGAGGSIGSELCRQVAEQRPARVVLFERSEPALYRIERELHKLHRDVEIVPVLGSVDDEESVRRTLEAFSVRTLYHSAAYKHVPLVEYNMSAGVQNNVFGTVAAARAAERAGVERFVLISTDKAVNPTNVMGATKRLAEMVLQGMHSRGTSMRICMVRFGNVLASSGSVVPLFREQIRAGGPVTVTHPEIVRYFMTITEAAQLVIQAGAMSEGGDVFLLDMSEPVKIVDLARKMIRLMGLEVRDDANPHGDIEIKYTGLRPAEKLYEELLIAGNASGTQHPRIWRAQEGPVSWPEVELALQSLRAAVAQNDCTAIREILRRVVDEYMPPSGLVDFVWRAGAKQRSLREASVVPISSRRPGPNLEGHSSEA